MAFTLEDLHDAIEKKYGGFDVQYGPNPTDVVKLRAGVRLNKDERKQLTDIAKDLETASKPEEAKGGSKKGAKAGSEEVSEDDVIAAMLAMIRIVADSSEGAERLIVELGEDLAAITVLWSAYQEATDPGEV